MSRDKQTEIHELAKQMSVAISTAVEQRYIEDEAKLEAVLRANGWVKAEEIFAEIDAIFRKHFQANKTKSVWEPDLLKEIKQVSRGTINNLWSDLAELKKKYTEEGK